LAISPLEAYFGRAAAAARALPRSPDEGEPRYVWWPVHARRSGPDAHDRGRTDRDCRYPNI